MLDNVVKDDTFEVKYSSKTHISFSMGQLLKQVLDVAYTVRVFYFYENEIFLAILLVGMGYVFYGLWNMINDPILGYFCDRSKMFLNRGGKRFPWIMIGSFLNILFFVLVFTPPNIDATVNPWPMFFYFLVIICLYDFFFSLWTTNYYSIFPIKFRSNRERRKVNALRTVFAQLGLFIAVILPPIFIEYGVRETYFHAALIIAGISLILAFSMIKGVKEDTKLREYYQEIEKKKQKESFLKNIKIALKEKNFLSYVIPAVLFNGFAVIALASLPFMMRYIFEVPADNEIILQAGFLLGGLLTVPLWTKLIKKWGNKRINLIGFFGTSIMLIFYFFVQTMIDALIMIIIIGIFVGSLWVTTTLILSDIVDEITLKYNKRQEGLYFGINTFFTRFEIVIQSLVFTAIHILFGFEPGAPTQTALAVIGLRIQFAIIPMIFMLIGGLIFLKWYDLTPDKSNEIQLQLKEINL